MNRAQLESLAAQWRRGDLLRALLLGFGIGLFAAGATAALFGGGAIPIVTLLVIASAAAAYLKRRPPVDAAAVAAHLNRLCPSLEESATLWLRDPAALSLVERLQLIRLDAAWNSLPERDRLGRPPAAPFYSALVAVVGGAIVLCAGLTSPHHRQTIQPPATPAAVAVVSVSPPQLTSARLEIAPPAYLGVPPRTLAGLDGEAPEGSAVVWEIETAGDAATLALELSGRPDPIVAERIASGHFRARAELQTTLLYQLVVTDTRGARTRWPALHALKAIRDEPPRLTWQTPAASRTVIDPARGRAVVDVRLAATDDHGVAGAHLVATVAKGSGEGVKFREQELPLARDGNVVTATLDLPALGLEPGDELYFHALATDRRTPTPNVARSETRFVVLRGPATELSDPGTAIAAVNRLPQYFRSQRQLILDTEQLLREQPQLSAAQFRARSEDIGIDQKLLRLRYGQFLGEEFEPATDGAPPEAEAMAAANQLRAGPDADKQRAAAIDRVLEQGHQHLPGEAGAEERPKTAEEIAAPFTHTHDNADAATLFDLQVKASLRAVLAAMWESEGLLRSAQPAAALPVENRALELLKAMQQADRIYVKRVGFEPTPIKIDERRLHGELVGIPPRAESAVPAAPADAALAAVRAALAFTRLSEADAAFVEAKLTEVARTKPELYVPALEIWRRRAGPLDPTDRATLRKALWSLLPAGTPPPERPNEPTPALAKNYFELLTAGETATR